MSALPTRPGLRAPTGDRLIETDAGVRCGKGKHLPPETLARAASMAAAESHEGASLFVLNHPEVARRGGVAWDANARLFGGMALDLVRSAFGEQVRVRAGEDVEAVLDPVVKVGAAEAEHLVDALAADDHRVAPFVTALVVKRRAVALHADSKTGALDHEIESEPTARRVDVHLGRDARRSREQRANGIQKQILDRTLGLAHWSEFTTGTDA